MNIAHSVHKSGAYLVPTPVGARFVLGGFRRDLRRLVLSALLRGGSTKPMPVSMLAALAGVADRRRLATTLFQLQREDWLTPTLSPLIVAPDPLGEAIPPLLEALSDSGQGVLANESGLCYAYSGYNREEADRVAAFSTALYPLWRLSRELPEQAGQPDMSTWTLTSSITDSRLTVCPIYVADQLLHLTVAGRTNLDSAAFVKLAALLLRRYLGTC